MNYVYFIGELSSIRLRNNQKYRAIKIGLTSDINKRMDQLQTGNSCELVIIALIKCQSRKHSEHIESSIHNRFKHQRIRGEWFDGRIKIKNIAHEFLTTDSINRHIPKKYNEKYVETLKSKIAQLNAKVCDMDSRCQDLEYELTELKECATFQYL